MLLEVISDQCPVITPVALMTPIPNPLTPPEIEEFDMNAQLVNVPPVMV
jgi:hypothetical protein